MNISIQIACICGMLGRFMFQSLRGGIYDYKKTFRCLFSLFGEYPKALYKHSIWPITDVGPTHVNKMSYRLITDTGTNFVQSFEKYDNWIYLSFRWCILKFSITYHLSTNQNTASFIEKRILPGNFITRLRIHYSISLCAFYVHTRSE